MSPRSAGQPGCRYPPCLCAAVAGRPGVAFGKVHRPNSHLGYAAVRIIGYPDNNSVRLPLAYQRGDRMLRIGVVTGRDGLECCSGVCDAISKCDAYTALTVIESQGAFLVYCCLVYLCRAPVVPRAIL